MKKLVFAIVVWAAFSLAACGATKSGISVSEPKTPVAPLSLDGDLKALDICQAILREDMEAVMGRKLASDPQPFEYYDTSGTNGCWFDGGKTADNEAFYSYVAFTPVEAYNTQPMYQDVAVSGIGQSAYFNNGADTRQLWVRVNDAVAFVVANGDRANEDGLKAIARLIVTAIR